MSGLDEKGLEAAYREFSTYGLVRDRDIEESVQSMIRAYLASATPADVGGEPVAWITPDGLAALLGGGACGAWPNNSDGSTVALYSATALERVSRERDEARAKLDEVCLSSRQEWQRATSAEAKLAEARKVIEPFADFGVNNTDADGWGGTRCEGERIRDWFGPSEFRAARQFAEEVK